MVEVRGSTPLSPTHRDLKSMGEPCFLLFYKDILLGCYPHSSKITLQSNQNRLVEVFRRLKYNDFIVETSTGIRNWICKNFMYRSKARVQVLNPH